MKQKLESHVEEMTETEKLKGEIKERKGANELFQKECRMIFEEYVLLKRQRFSHEYMDKKKEQFCSTIGLNPDCFIRLFENVKPGKDCVNIKFYDTSQRLS